MDRRTIIEEAAGITKFRVRQRAAEARLESARSNLSRVSDIIAEIERQVNSLRRQAAKARRYRIQKEKLRELLSHVYVEEALNARLFIVESELERLRQAEAKLNADNEQATLALRAAEDSHAQSLAAVA